MRLSLAILAAAGLFLTPATTIFAQETAEAIPADMPSLKGLVLVGDPAEVVSVGLSDVQGIHAPGLPVLEDPDFLRRIEPYIGQDLSMEMLNSLNREIIAYYKDAGFPLVDVVLPEQDATNGVVQMVVIKSRVGRVLVEGGDYLPVDDLRARMRLKPDEPVRSDIILQDLEWLNRNPFREVNVVYQKGAEYGQTDVVVQARDRRPIRVSASYANTGNRFLGYDRYNAGLTFNPRENDLLYFQMTMGEDFNTYRSHSFSYVAPFRNGHTASISSSLQRTTSPFFGAAGRQESEAFDLGLRYGIELPKPDAWKNFSHQITFGIDYKRFTSDLYFGRNQINATGATHVGQFVASWNSSLRDKWGATGLVASLYMSPGDVIDDEADYAYGTLGINRVTRLPGNLTWSLDFVAQASNDALPSSEQFGLGGYATVRGYDEREILNDNGLYLRNELRSPPFSVMSWLGKSPSDSMQVLAFLDAGWSVGEFNSKGVRDLVGTGFGIRYNIQPYVSFRFDLGWQLEESGVRTNGDSWNEDGVKGHLSLMLAY